MYILIANLWVIAGIALNSSYMGWVGVAWVGIHIIDAVGKAKADRDKIAELDQLMEQMMEEKNDLHDQKL